jgi:hypothetical protein
MTLSLLRLFCVQLLLALTFSVPVLAASPDINPNPPGLADGGGVWANIWNYPDGDLDVFCANLRLAGVRNLFLQTSRSNTPAIAHPDKLGPIIDACHRHKIRVIAWSFAELTSPQADAEKMVAAAKFLSPQGDHIDAVAPNLEKNLVDWRVEEYSKTIRNELGNSFPMMAVVYSPLNHCQEVARIPWSVLARYYDVIAPMSYWNSKYQKLDAYDYTVATVRTIRQLTGRPDIEIHVIGDGMGTSPEAIVNFMRGCQAAEATSASIYPNQKITTAQLAAVSRYEEYFQPNSRFRLAAFRAMLKSGALSLPADADPSEPISRSEFLSLVTRHLRGPQVSGEAPRLSNAPRVPIYSKEAFGLLAQLVDVEPAGKGHKRRSWFAQPAMAESTPEIHSGSDRPLNYLDAALMVVEAGSAIK